MVSNRALEIFVAVYEEGGMTRAGQKIHMSQPAVSQTIKEIEYEYDTELFERYGSKLYVTQAGKILYDYAKRILNLYEDLEQAINLHEGVRVIRVGCNISSGTAQIIPLINQFHEAYPDIEVKTMVFQAPVIMRALQQNELDIGLIEDQRRGSYKEFIFEPYYKDKIVIVCNNEHPFAGKTVPLSSLNGQPFLFRERGAGVREMFDHILSLNNINVKVCWECTSTDAIVEAVKLNMGLSVLPYLLVKKSIDAGEISTFELSDVSLSRNLNVVYHKDKVLTKPLEHFMELTKALK